MSEGASEAAVPRPARGPRSRKDDQVDAAPRQNTGSVQSMLSTSSRADRTPRLIVLVSRARCRSFTGTRRCRCATRRSSPEATRTSPATDPHKLGLGRDLRTGGVVERREWHTVAPPPMPLLPPIPATLPWVVVLVERPPSATGSGRSSSGARIPRFTHPKGPEARHQMTTRIGQR